MHRKTAGPFILFIFLCALTTCASAQKNELSFTLGAIHSSSQQITAPPIVCPAIFPGCNNLLNFKVSTDVGVAFEGTYTRQLFTFSQASLDLEVPVVRTLGRNSTVRFGPGPIPIDSFAPSVSSLFFTPSARVKFFHSSPISPFVSVGGGLAHSGESFFPGGSSSKNAGALQFGGGVDFKTPIPHLAVRAEVRDFWARGILRSSFSAQVSPERQHNIFAGGGIVFRF